MEFAKQIFKVVDKYYDEEVCRECIKVELGIEFAPRYLEYDDDVWELSFVVTKTDSLQIIAKYKLKYIN